MKADVFAAGSAVQATHVMAKRALPVATVFAVLIGTVPTTAQAQRVLLNGSFEDNAPPLDGTGNYFVSCADPRVVEAGSWGGYVAAEDVPGWDTSASHTTGNCS